MRCGLRPRHLPFWSSLKTTGIDNLDTLLREFVRCRELFSCADSLLFQRHLAGRLCSFGVRLRPAGSRHDSAADARNDHDASAAVPIPGSEPDVYSATDAEWHVGFP